MSEPKPADSRGHQCYQLSPDATGCEEAALDSHRVTRGKVVLAALASTPAGAQEPPAFACVCHPAGKSGGTADPPARRRDAHLPEFTKVMLIHEASLNFQLVRLGDAEPLTTAKRLLHYLAEGISEGTGENFWLVCMNPKRRPICRIRLKDGPLVAASVSVREVFRVVLLTEARSIACLRTQGNVPVRPGAADRRLLSNLRATCRYMKVELADYLIARFDGGDYYSWHEHGSGAE